MFNTAMKGGHDVASGVTAVPEILVLGRYDLNFTGDANDQIRSASKKPIHAHS